MGMSADKDIAACLDVLLPQVGAVHFITAASPRSASLEQLHGAVRDSQNQAKVAAGNGDVTESVQAAVRECCEWNSRRSADEPEELLLICGSFFIFRDVRPALGLQYPTDPIDLNESSLQPKDEQSATAAASARLTAPPSASSFTHGGLNHRSSTSHLPSASTTPIQQPIRSISSNPPPPTPPPQPERHYQRPHIHPSWLHTPPRLCPVPLPAPAGAGSALLVALTVTAVADVRKEFRGAKECGVEEARERLRVGRGQLAYLRTQVERVYWRAGEVVGEKDVRRDHQTTSSRRTAQTRESSSGTSVWAMHAQPSFTRATTASLPQLRRGQCGQGQAGERSTAVGVRRGG